MPSSNLNLDRIYTVKFRDICGFVPGRNATGEQILFGVLSDSLLVAFFFSADGRFLRYAFRPVGKQPDPNLTTPPRLQLAYILQEAMEVYMKEMCMVGGDIQIRHFAFPDWNIGIAEWPDAYFIRLQTCGGYPPDGSDSYDQSIVEWKENNRWVMHWNNEYWMLENGEVESN